MTTDPAAHARELAAKSANGPTGWFEELYTEAADGRAVVPWDRGVPSAQLAQWAEGRDGTGKRALVVGCGLGRDSEYLARLGYDTVAFDISATAIATARERHPDTTVEYVTADLLDLPAEWHHGFDLVLESYNVQALPEPLRTTAIAALPPTVAAGGTLLVVAVADTGRDPGDGPPWPLTRTDIDAFATDGLTAVSVERIPDPLDPPVHRWLAEFTRPA